MTKLFTTFFALLVAVVTVTAQAQELKGDAKAGQAINAMCIGCHGIKGNAAPAELPNLQGRVGWFMCLPEVRDYLMRLPNIARSRIDDNDQLAALMNFMVFGLGGKSTPAGTKPFTAAEVAVGRTRAFTSVSLIKTRAQIVEKVIQKCGAPASLRLMYPQGTSAMQVLAAAGKPPKS